MDTNITEKSERMKSWRDFIDCWEPAGCKFEDSSNCMDVEAWKADDVDVGSDVLQLAFYTLL